MIGFNIQLLAGSPTCSELSLLKTSKLLLRGSQQTPNSDQLRENMPTIQGHALAWLSLPLARSPACHLNPPLSAQTRKKSSELLPSKRVLRPRGTYGYSQD